MYCSKCGKEIINYKNFCPFCGMAIKEIISNQNNTTEDNNIFENTSISPETELSTKPLYSYQANIGFNSGTANIYEEYLQFVSSKNKNILLYYRDISKVIEQWGVLNIYPRSGKVISINLPKGVAKELLPYIQAKVSVIQKEEVKVRTDNSESSTNDSSMEHEPIENGTPIVEGAVYSIDGVRGRHIDVFEDKCVINTKVGIGSFLTGNLSDGEKTIYYADCIGVQFKRSNLQIGYLQLETASSTMNNTNNNFFTENTFTFDTSKITNEKMEEVADYVKKKVEEVKRMKNVTPVALSPADELKKFKELLDLGAITQEEFDAKKKQILNI